LIKSKGKKEYSYKDNLERKEKKRELELMKAQ